MNGLDMYLCTYDRWSDFPLCEIVECLEVCRVTHESFIKLDALTDYLCMSIVHMYYYNCMHICYKHVLKYVSPYILFLKTEE